MNNKNAFINFSPFVALGVVVVLVPIFALMTMNNIREQDRRSVEKLAGRGISLIRAFEAGSRTGMMFMGFGVQRLQRLLAETALQPGVIYMMITSEKGKILAHSDPEMVGKDYPDMPDISTLKKPGDLLYREVESEFHDLPSGASEPVFQVFKRFTPSHRRSRKGHPLPPWPMNGDEKPGEGDSHLEKSMLTGESSDILEHPEYSSGRHGEGRGRWKKGHSPERDDYPRSRKNEFEKKRDWFREHFLPHVLEKRGNFFYHSNQIIFIGLDLSEERVQKRAYLRHAVIMGILFFALGCAGIVALLAFQGYRSARSSLSRVKAFSDRVVDNMPVGLITIDEQVRVTSCNDAARKILNQPRSGEGSTMEIVLPSEMREVANELMDKKTPFVREIECSLFPVLPGEEESRSGRKEDSQTRQRLLEVNASPIWEDETLTQYHHDHHNSAIIENNQRLQQYRNVSGYLFLFQDLTELKALKSEIDRSRRLASVGKLAAGVAHEIRNPLSSIKGFATWFRERYGNQAEDREIADVMIHEVERLNRSVTQLLELARPLPVSTTTVNLKDILDHSIKLVTHDFKEKKILVDFQIHETLTDKQIETDPDRVNQILLNLYLNAMQAMEESGGVLTIRVAETTSGEAVLIEVIDTGQGIDVADLEHIFDPYFTNRPGGTGLGLAMVHRAIESLGAEIRVESRRGKGSRFIIKLPIDKPGGTHSIE